MDKHKRDLEPQIGRIDYSRPFKTKELYYNAKGEMPTHLQRQTQHNNNTITSGVPLAPPTEANTIE